MHELLSVNERYHELLQAHEAQRRELDVTSAELKRTRAALAAAEAKVAEQSEQISRTEATVASAREATKLQAAQIEAADSERGELHRVVRNYTERLLHAEKALEESTERRVQAEAWTETHWQSGYEEGVAQQRAELRARLSRAKVAAETKSREAFEHGRQAAAAEATSRLLREQAERRLLLHQAEEARLQQNELKSKLKQERTAREQATDRSSAVEQRLNAVRHHKGKVESELNAARAAHAADLDHFEEMESALGMACNEYTALASARSHARTPPRAAPYAMCASFGASPADAIRTSRPVPSDV